MRHTYLQTFAGNKLKLITGLSSLLQMSRMLERVRLLFFIRLQLLWAELLGLWRRFPVFCGAPLRARTLHHCLPSRKCGSRAALLGEECPHTVLQASIWCTVMTCYICANFKLVLWTILKHNSYPFSLLSHFVAAEDSALRSGGNLRDWWFCCACVAQMLTEFACFIFLLTPCIVSSSR